MVKIIKISKIVLFDIKLTLALVRTCNYCHSDKF